MFHHSVRNFCPTFVRNETKKCPKIKRRKFERPTFFASTVHVRAQLLLGY